MQEGVLWAGTDDGQLHVTRNGGASWTNVVDNIEGVPDTTWIHQVKPSSYDAGTAVVVFDNHRRNDWTPYVYRTTDYGESWTRLADADDVEGYALSFIQDPEERDLMFLGTELGLYFSADRGDTWHEWTHGYPTASTMDLAIQEREADLVVGTFGRAAYVLDDLRPLRALAREGPQVLNDSLRAFATPDAYLALMNEAPGTRFSGDAFFEGENRPYGARLSYVVTPPASDTGEAASGEEVTIEIVDDGAVIRTLKGPAEAGLNRTTWRLRRKGVRGPTTPKEAAEKPDGEPAGPEVMPGTYTVRYRYDDHVDSTTVTVKPDPRIEGMRAAQEDKLELYDRLMSVTEAATEAADRLREAKRTTSQIDDVLGDRDDEAATTAKDKGKAMRDSIKALMQEVEGKDVQGIRRDPSVVSSRLGMARFYLGSSVRASDQSDRRALERAEKRVQRFLNGVNQFFADDWPAYQKAVTMADISFFKDREPVRMPQNE